MINKLKIAPTSFRMTGTQYCYMLYIERRFTNRTDQNIKIYDTNNFRYAHIVNFVSYVVVLSLIM